MEPKETKEVVKGWGEIGTEDFSRNFIGDWTMKELRGFEKEFNNSNPQNLEDLELRNKLLLRIFSANIVKEIKVEKIGLYATPKQALLNDFGHQLPPPLSPQFQKINVEGNSLVLYEKVMEKPEGLCNCCPPRPTWEEKKKIPLSKIKGVKIKKTPYTTYFKIILS